MSANRLSRLAVGLALLAGGLTGFVSEVGAQEVKLKVSHFLAPKHIYHEKVLLPWVEEIKRKSQGRVDIAVFPAASLCKPTQQYECAKSGIADIAFGPPGWTPGRFPMTSVMELPFLFKTAAGGSRILADLWDRYISREYDDVQVLYMNTATTFHVHTRLKLIRTLEDFKGVKIRVPSAVAGDILDALGATQVGMTIDQVYEAMARGVVDGTALTYEVLLPYRLYEVARYHTEVGMSTISFAAFMNRARYESLPPDVRRLLVETTSAAGGYWRRLGEIWDQADAVARRLLVDQKHELYVVPPSERRRWREAVKGLDETWAAALEAKGIPGRALAKEARALAVKYGEAD